jgi:hypothetical protein
MFVSAAVKLTPETEELFRPLLADLGLPPSQTDILREMLTLRQLPNGPSIAEITTSSDLTGQTVRKLDQQVSSDTKAQQYKSARSRPEFTDAAMAVRAECVMLNKGPYILDAIEALVSVMVRIARTSKKKFSRLRALHW